MLSLLDVNRQWVRDLETEILGRVHSRIFRALLDLLILMQLRNSAKSGRDIVRFVNTRFHVQLSSGTIYSVLYTLEKEDLVKSELRQQKRFFELTDKGESITRAILNSYREISNYSASLFITSLGIEKLS